MGFWGGVWEGRGPVESNVSPLFAGIGLYSPALTLHHYLCFGR